MNSAHIAQLRHYQQEMQQELAAILDYWASNMVDRQQGGFYGRIDQDNTVYPDAPKGAVLNGRILWTYAAAFNLTGQLEHLALAGRAFDYIRDHFIDPAQGGVYWSVNAKGQPLDTKKQFYALAFILYGLAEYYRAAQNEAAKTMAIELFHTIEKYSRDPQSGGYLEALARDWQALPDLRLSAKDANEKKTMNTHLHVLEAYTNLYRIWPAAELKEAIISLLRIFLDRIIDPASFHLRLFFDEQWVLRSNIISYGHDIEAAWLLQEAAEVLTDEQLLQEVKQAGLQLAAAAARGLDKDGGLWYEYNGDTHHLVREKHWWPQAEAMVGFFNAWQVSGQVQYLNHSLNSWGFTRQYLLDRRHGEWYWGIREDHTLMPGEDKAGFWKCPYHNGRACMELIRRIHTLLPQ